MSPVSWNRIWREPRLAPERSALKGGTARADANGVSTLVAYRPRSQTLPGSRVAHVHHVHVRDSRTERAPRRLSRPASLVAAATSLVMAAAYLLLAVRVVFSARIGDTAVALTETHGVHTGDALALPLAAFALVCVAFAAACLDHWARRPMMVLAPRRPRISRAP